MTPFVTVEKWTLSLSSNISSKVQIHYHTKFYQLVRSLVSHVPRQKRKRRRKPKLSFALEVMHDERTDPLMYQLKPGLFVIGFIQNERKLSSSGSISFSSWHTNSQLVHIQHFRKKAQLAMLNFFFSRLASVRAPGSMIELLCSTISSRCPCSN